MVAQKEERSRLATASQGLYRTTETGRIDPVETPVVVREYWVRSPDGTWYRVSADKYEGAEVGRALEICR